MDIHAAASYLKSRYRIRRACWEPEEFIEHNYELSKRSVSYYSVWNKETKTIEKHRGIQDDDTFTVLTLEDLLATDWEVITTGIRKYFNKYGHLEYDDETDWDNYVPNENAW